MAEVIIQRLPGGDVYCYDAPTNGVEVNETLHNIVLQFGMYVNVWVVSGTHGRSDGTVTNEDAEPDFRQEDLDTANRTSKQIKVWNYPQLAPNRWAELKGKPSPTNVIVLAFCYSQQWYNNPNDGGNHGKL